MGISAGKTCIDVKFSFPCLLFSPAPSFLDLLPCEKYTVYAYCIYIHLHDIKESGSVA